MYMTWLTQILQQHILLYAMQHMKHGKIPLRHMWQKQLPTGQLYLNRLSGIFLFSLDL